MPRRAWAGASRCLFFADEGWPAPLCAWACRIALALCACAVGCGSGPASSGDVLLISVDTLRPDHLESYGYERGTSPQLERWFEDGAIFERAYAAHASTPPSVVSILSGQYPPEHRVRLFFQLLPDETRVLPDWLPERYQSAAFVSNGVLTDEALGMAGRFDHYDDHVDERESSRKVFERSAGRTTDAALAWLATQRDPARPLFLWLHYNDPHGPYRAPDDAPARFSHEKRVPVQWRRIRDYQRDLGVADALDFVDRYDEEIAYVDAEIDRLLRGYAAHSDIDAALVVVTADHGESMIEHERWFTHGYEVYEEIIRVPLMLRGPGVVSGRFDEIVSSIDVAPTILRHLGIPQPKALPGTSPPAARAGCRRAHRLRGGRRRRDAPARGDPRSGQVGGTHELRRAHAECTRPLRPARRPIRAGAAAGQRGTARAARALRARPRPGGPACVRAPRRAARRGQGGAAGVAGGSREAAHTRLRRMNGSTSV